MNSMAFDVSVRFKLCVLWWHTRNCCYCCCYFSWHLFNIANLQHWKLAHSLECHNTHGISTADVITDCRSVGRKLLQSEIERISQVFHISWDKMRCIIRKIRSTDIECIKERQRVNVTLWGDCWWDDANDCLLHGFKCVQCFVVWKMVAFV